MAAIMRARLATFLLLALAAPAAAETGPDPVAGETRGVILAGNNWEGTTDVVDPYTFERIDRINVIPDKEEREAAIMMDPVDSVFFALIREQVGEGHNQYNDDVFSSHDGRTIYVSRPSYADVVAIDLKTKEIVWRFPVDGQRADHMGISPDGKKLLVSASTANVVHEIDLATGTESGRFASGDSPHESNYSADGSTIYHASIGRVYLPTDSPQEDSTTKGSRVFLIVDADTLEVKKTLDMGAKLEEAGFPDMSSAVRPMALAPDEKTLYFQVSFFHGFVEYDLATDKVTRIAKLPVSESTQKLQRSDYLLDSAHHGLAINGAGTKLCAAATMSNYAAIVDRKTFAFSRVNGITKPYWSTNSHDGRLCYVSGSGDDAVHVLSYMTGKRVAKFPVGFHPQRVRNGVARLDIYPRQDPGAFRLKLGTKNGTYACRAAGKAALSGCAIRVVQGGRTVATGERLVPGARRIAVRTSGSYSSGQPARVVAVGTDVTGRRKTVRKRLG
jgi:DNA-binding beta-propeller fold protein YncE